MYRYNATAVRVVDGDTVRFNVDLGFNIWFEENFRVCGIDAPEIRGEERPEGLRSKARVEELLPVGSECQIRTMKNPGKYGRWLADIYYQSDEGFEANLADTLVQEGLAGRYD